MAPRDRAPRATLWPCQLCPRLRFSFHEPPTTRNALPSSLGQPVACGGCGDGCIVPAPRARLEPV
jgi:hypothetical protein